MPNPTLTFNPVTSVAITDSFVILDPAAVVTDGGNALNSIHILLGGNTGSLGIASGGTLSVSGTIGLINYQYSVSRRILTLNDNTAGQTALGADFTAVLRLVAYDRGAAIGGSTRSISVNLGRPIYLASTGHYHDYIAENASGTNAPSAAAAKNFLGLTGYVTNVTSAVKNAFLATHFPIHGWIGGSSAGTLTTKPRIWKWSGGPEAGETFWTGDFLDGVAPAGVYTNWASNRPNNAGAPSDPNNYTPCVLFGVAGSFGPATSFKWDIDAGGSNYGGYHIEYSTVSGVGDDGLGGTRKVSSMLVNFDPIVVALLQSTTAIEVALVNGVVTSAIGVPLGSVTIGATNATHIQVSIDLGTNNSGKRRQAQGFRLINGSERDLASTRTRIGEVYTFVFLRTVDGSNSVNLLLN